MPGLLDAMLDARPREMLVELVAWDPAEHPRGVAGMFRDKVAALAQGSAVKLPDGVYVKHEGRKYVVGHGSSVRERLDSATAAAEAALNDSSRRQHPKSIGGAKAFVHVRAAIEHADSKKKARESESPLGSMLEARGAIARMTEPKRVDARGQRHTGGGKFGAGQRDVTHAGVLKAVDDAHAKVKAVHPRAADDVKAARDYASKEHADTWDVEGVARNLRAAHEKIKGGVSKADEEAIAALGAAHELHLTFRRKKAAPHPVGHLVPAAPRVTEAELAESYLYRQGGPEDALGRAARQVSVSGAMYLGGGVGFEKVGEKFSVTGGGKSQAHAGPLSAAVAAFGLAGASTSPDSPGGATVISDPAAAARVRELDIDARVTERDIDRLQRELRAEEPRSQGGLPLPTPPRAIDWRTRRLTELRARLASILAERRRLLAEPSRESELVQEGLIGRARAAYDERKHKRGGFSENRGWFSPGAGPPATSGKGVRGKVSSKPDAPDTRPPSGLKRPYSPLRPDSPGLAPKTPSHHQEKLDEKQLASSVGKGSWSPRSADAVQKLSAGTVEDTEQHYRTKLPDGSLGPYTPERIDLHNRIYALLFQGAGFHKGEKREAIFMAGGPASGKSRLIKDGKVELPPDAVDVNPDIVKTMLPEYDALVKAGDPKASSKVHEESSHIAKMAMNLALARGHHVVVDGTGDSGPGKFRGKIEATLNAGYEARVIYATTATDVAEKRADERAKETGRHVPTGYLRATHRDVSKRFVEDISAIPGVGVEVYDTTDGANLLARIRKGTTTPDIRDPRGFQAFLDKGELPKTSSYGDWLTRNFGGARPVKVEV